MAVQCPFLLIRVSMFYTYRDINLAKYEACTNLAESLYPYILHARNRAKSIAGPKCISRRSILKKDPRKTSEQNYQSGFWQVVRSRPVVAFCILPQSINTFCILALEFCSSAIEFCTSAFSQYKSVVVQQNSAISHNQSQRSGSVSPSRSFAPS